MYVIHRRRNHLRQNPKVRWNEHSDASRRSECESFREVTAGRDHRSVSSVPTNVAVVGCCDGGGGRRAPGSGQVCRNRSHVLAPTTNPADVHGGDQWRTAIRSTLLCGTGNSGGGGNGGGGYRLSLPCRSGFRQTLIIIQTDWWSRQLAQYN